MAKKALMKKMNGLIDSINERNKRYDKRTEEIDVEKEVYAVEQKWVCIFAAGCVITLAIGLLIGHFSGYDMAIAHIKDQAVLTSCNISPLIANL